MPDPVTAAEVRAAVRAVMAAYPKGTRFGAASVVIKDGGLHITVTPAEDSVQAPSEEGLRDEIRRKVRERTRAAGCP